MDAPGSVACSGGVELLALAEAQNASAVEDVAAVPVAVEEQAAVLVVRGVLVPAVSAAERVAAVQVVEHARIRAEAGTNNAPVAAEQADVPVGVSASLPVVR